MRVRPSPAPAVPVDSLVFGYGPMLPFVAAALGAWLLPEPWPTISLRLAVILGALILTFVAGVRRGFGFGRPDASTRVEIATMLLYVTLAGLALVLPDRRIGCALLVAGFAAAAVLDTRAARRGDTPRFFARLRPPQFGLAAVSLAALLGQRIA